MPSTAPWARWLLTRNRKVSVAEERAQQAFPVPGCSYPPFHAYPVPPSNRGGSRKEQEMGLGEGKDLPLPESGECAGWGRRGLESEERGGSLDLP